MVGGAADTVRADGNTRSRGQHHIDQRDLLQLGEDLARFPALHGLCWRPRLGGAGLASMLFGDSCAPGALTVTSGPTDIDSGSGFVKVFAIAQSANIKIIG